MGADLAERPSWLIPALWILLGVAATAGMYGRIRGLGFSALADDEYYFLTSIQAILERGIPELEAGGIYTRGVVLQYLTAPFILLVSDEELALRLPSVLLGLGAVVLAYFYGRRTVGRTYALCLAILLLVSSWQIEFSRFGRMYAGFQFLTLGFLLAIHDALDSAGEPRRYLAHALCVVGILVHQLAVFLLPLLLLPLLRPQVEAKLGGRAATLRYASVTGAAFLLVLAYRRIDFRRYGVEGALPSEGVVGGAGAGLSPPTFTFWQVAEASTVNLTVAVAALILVGAIVFALHRSGRLEAPAAVGCVLVTAALLHFLMVAFLLLVLMTARYRIHRTYRDQRFAAAAAALGTAVALGWVAYAGFLTFGLDSRAWIHESGNHLFRDAFRQVFIWPDPGPAVIEPWARELPVLGAALFGALLVQVWIRGREPLPQLLRNPAMVVAYIVLILGFFEPLYQVTRYTFFLYPVALATLALSAKDLFEAAGRRLSRRALGVFGVPALLVLFASTEDFNPGHILRVSSVQATYRTGPFERFSTTWYDRDDYAAPADFVAAAAGPDEAVLVEEAPPVSYYLERDHAVYMDRRGTRFRLVSRERGTRDFWSSRRLLGTPSEVHDYTRDASVVWIVRAAWRRQWIDPSQVWGRRLLGVERVFSSPDGALEVVRVRLEARSARQSRVEPARGPPTRAQAVPAALPGPSTATR